MAAAEISLDNEVLSQEGMQVKLKQWVKRESSSKSSEGVQPNKEGEWMLVTVDCSSNKKEEQAEWIFGPAAPGPFGRPLEKDEFGEDDDLDEAVKASLADGIFAMKCLANGKRWVVGTVADSPYKDLEDYEFPCKKKNGKAEKPKKGKGVPSMLIASVKDQIMYIVCADLMLTSPKVRMQFARNKENLKNALNAAKKAYLDISSLQELTVQAILDQAESLNILV